MTLVEIDEVLGILDKLESNDQNEYDYNRGIWAAWNAIHDRFNKDKYGIKNERRINTCYCGSRKRR